MSFQFEPAEIPERRRNKPGKYAETIEKVLALDAKSARINTGDVKLNSMYLSFRRVIDKKYKGKVQVLRVDGELYLEKL